MNALYPSADADGVRGGEFVTVENLCLYGAMFLTLAGMVLLPLRYLAYGTPYLCLIAVLARGRGYVPREAWPFLALIALGLVMLPFASGRGIKDLYFMVSGVSIGFAFADKRLSGPLLLVLFAVGHAGALLLSGRSMGMPGLDLTGSYSAFESSFSFLFGLLAVSALADGRRALALLAFLAAAIAFKRIVIAAVLLCALVWWLPTMLRRWMLSVPMAVIGSAAYIAVVIGFTEGAFDELVKETVGTSANAFTMGRQFRYEAAVDALMAELPRYFVIGDGPGAGYDYLTAGTGLAGKANLHNDLLKIFIEYGGIALVVFIALLYAARNPAQRLLALYVHVLLLTDNVLIYHFFLFFYVLLGSALAPPRPPPQESGYRA